MGDRREIIRRVLDAEGGNVPSAARRLGMGRSAFWEHLNNLDMADLPGAIRAAARRMFVVE